MEEQREKQVIQILKSSTAIEKFIHKTYRIFHSHVKWHPSVKDEQMPTFVGFLYDQIISLNSLPSLNQFINGYMDTYYKNVQPEEIIYHTYVNRISKAYSALVRDLHFYFKLRESNLFTDVQLSYAYDIEAKQDLVVTIGDKKLGLQLFEGVDKHIEMKKKQTARRRIILGYPDLYLPLRGSRSNPVNIGPENHEFLVHSFKDVEMIYDEVLSVSNKDELVEDPNYIYPNTIESENNNLNENKGIQDFIYHSLIYVGKNNILNHLTFIKSLIDKGIKVEWISPFKVTKQDLPNDMKNALSNIRIHTWEKSDKYNIKVVDGHYNQSEEELLQELGAQTTFNFDQFKTEHAPTNKHMVVEAGAGTGKTETMISRLIFLLHTNELEKLEDVVLITFTNEAADQIKSKLMKRLYEFYKITGNICYINWSEEVTSIRIMTIPAFAKSIIKDFTPELGLGIDFSIRSLTMERRQIIEEELDTYINQENLEFSMLGEIQEYKLIDMIERFWTQFEQKGVAISNENTIEWGKPPVTDLKKNYHKLIKNVLFNCEIRFNELKQRNNVFTVNDLTQQISNIEKLLNKREISAPFKYLFVDEFQDTDDIQINLVNILTEIMEDAQLFVVGDVKQSIYRFRGANYTAFDELCSKFNKDKTNRDFKLKKNYRSNMALLETLENMFDKWRAHPEKILPREMEEERLVSTKDYQKYQQPYHFKALYNPGEYNISKDIKDLYNSIKIDQEDVEAQKPTTLAILVRTNFQAKKIRDILESMRQRDKYIIYDVVTGGDLFSSDASRDLLILLNAFSYYKDPESYYSLFQTPFTDNAFNPVDLIQYEGIRSSFVENESFSEVEGFWEAMEALRFKPPLHAIYQFLSSNPFEEVLSGSLQSHEIEKYRLNLYRILELAEEAVEGVSSIQSLRDWLRIQVESNRNEDEVEVEVTDYRKMIKVLTVHKAKGLEFDTVFVPYTHKKFEKNYENEVIIKKGNRMKIGWNIEVPNNGPIESPLYPSLKNEESKEVIREETRLLYVALTRAKNRLLVLYRKSNTNNSNLNNWSDLIRLGRGSI